MIIDRLVVPLPATAVFLWEAGTPWRSELEFCGASPLLLHRSFCGAGLWVLSGVANPVDPSCLIGARARGVNTQHHLKVVIASHSLWLFYYCCHCHYR